MMAARERQVVTDLAQVRRDHLARYEWAAARIRGGSVIDAACGCGYGAKLLADKGCEVFAIDVSMDAVLHGIRHWGHSSISWNVRDLNSQIALPPAHTVVSFETIEHLDNPEAFLARCAESAGKLFASVPNEDVIPFKSKTYPFHKRHYTQEEFGNLLLATGWRPVGWFGQADKQSEVVAEERGRTIVVKAERVG